MVKWSSSGSPLKFVTRTRLRSQSALEVCLGGRAPLHQCAVTGIGPTKESVVRLRYLAIGEDRQGITPGFPSSDSRTKGRAHWRTTRPHADCSSKGVCKRHHKYGTPTLVELNNNLRDVVVRVDLVQSFQGELGYSSTTWVPYLIQVCPNHSCPICLLGLRPLDWANARKSLCSITN